MFLSSMSLNKKDCPTASNTADSEGTVRECGGTITNCIVWSNEPYEIHGSAANVSYCDIKGGWEGEGNINIDPNFIEDGWWDLGGL
jgi:hypothetical protein